MKPLNQKKKYKGFPLSGSDRVFYGKFPYRIKLSGNNIINYDEGPFPSYNDNFFEILHFCDDYPKTVKLLNSFRAFSKRSKRVLCDSQIIFMELK